MLWTLLVLVSSAMFVVAAIVTARHENAGLPGFLAAVTVAVLLAVANFLAVEKVAAEVAHRVDGLSNRVQERFFRTLYAALVLWIFTTPIVASFIALMVVRVAR